MRIQNTQNVKSVCDVSKKTKQVKGLFVLSDLKIWDVLPFHVS